MRLRLLAGLGVSAVIAAVATAVAGPLYGALPGSVPQIGLLAWLYVSAVVLIGVGLHSFLGRWTTLTSRPPFVRRHGTAPAAAMISSRGGSGVLTAPGSGGVARHAR